MSGFRKNGSRLEIIYGSRTVLRTDGTLLQFLTSSQSYSANLNWPDATKSELYQWEYGITRASGGNFNATRFARSVVGARPQEWSNNVVLGAIPTGADCFFGRVILNRTIAPSHTWITQTITPMIPQNVAIEIGPGSGSMIIEAAAGIIRSCTIDIVGSNLVARLEQSVGPAAGNFGQEGTNPPAVPASSIPPNNFVSGSENVAVSGAGLPVYWQDVAPYYVNDALATTNATAAVLHSWNAQYGRSAQVSYSDPTDYASRYSLSLSGRFGRRS